VPDLKPLKACLFPLVECGDTHARIGGQLKKTERFAGVKSVSLSQVLGLGVAQVFDLAWCGL
jgi:hypothetical protein